MAKRHEPTSAFFRLCLSKIRKGSQGAIALDIPSGHGRHAIELAQQGWSVIAADIDNEAILETQATLSALSEALPISLVRLDATRPLPFRPGSFDLAVVIHAHSLDVLVHAQIVVRHRGHIIFETFGAQGRNWRALPGPLQVITALAKDFETIEYQEQPVKRMSSAVTVKALVQRRRV